MATSTVKPELPALKTPLTAPLTGTYPSELRSPAMRTPTYIKREDAMKTPITPPVAYLDFLNKLSPTILSPQSASALVKFSLPEKAPLTSTTALSDSMTTTSSSISLTSTATATGTGISRPASPRSNPSRASSCSGESQKSDTTIQPKPASVSIPSSSFARPISARTPRRLHIPQSPYSPASVRSPLSAASVYSPYSATISPREWESEKQGALSNGSTRSVSVRQVVTRTVTYSSRTPIVEPVPANKKRKLDN